MERNGDMNARPFSCAYLPALRVNETRIELSYRSTDAGHRARAASEFGALMTSIARVGSHGGFSGDRFHPRDSNVVVRESAKETGELAWSFAHSNVGPELVFALENLAQNLHFRDRALNEVRIWTALSAQMQGPMRRDMKCYQPVPFDYMYDVTSPTVVVDVEFLDRQEAQRMEVCRAAFDAWYAVAAAGVFADEEFRPSGERAIFIENELQITSIGMQVVYARARVGESGFNVLANMLTRFHWEVARLDQVEIA